MATFSSLTNLVRQSPLQFAGNVLSERKNVQNTGHIGNWGTVDLGFTEAAKRALIPKVNAQESVLGETTDQGIPGLIGAPSGISFGKPIGPNEYYDTKPNSAIKPTGATITGDSAIVQAQNNFNTALNQNRDQNLSIIDSQFNEEMGRLNDLEGRTRTNYASAIQQAQDYYPQFQKQLESEKATDLGAITAQEDQAKMESNRGLARTRQLLSDLQRSQAARMSATGNYSSSVADAFGESFGRKAFDANNQIQSARDQALQQLSQQKQQTENFYSRKSLEAKQSYDQQLNQLQMQLQSQLDAINNARGTASSAKAQATAEAWNSYTNNKLNLDQQILQYQLDLDSWKSQQDSFIQEAVDYSNPNVVQDILGNLQGDSISMAPTTQNTPQSQVQQAQQILSTSRKPMTWEELQANQST